MPTIEETLDNIKNFIEDVKIEHPENVSAAAISAASLISNRVVETGENSSGVQLGEYSDGMYKNFRASKGREIGFVNLSFTGDMWNDVGVLNVQSDGVLTVATIGASNSENDEKLFYNSVRYNDEILDLNEEEALLINDDLDNKLQIIADKNFK